MNIGIAGLQWGDEGKGRITDYLTGILNADAGNLTVIRFQGGDNAGHTVQVDGESFKFHGLPSGILHKNVRNVIGPGCVVNPEGLVNEIETLERQAGFVIRPSILKISPRATIILPEYLYLEREEEARLKDDGFLPTMRGIAPAYGERWRKHGVQLGSCCTSESFYSEMERVSKFWIEPENSVQKVYKLLWPQIEKLLPHVEEWNYSSKDNLVLETQLGALRDIIHGIYPFTTSSHTLLAYGSASLGGNLLLDRRIAVLKAYSSCVGAGPFVTEFLPDHAEKLRKEFGEYGATTGRARRLGALDLVAVNYGIQLQGATELALTCIDRLSGWSTIPVCTEYSLNGETFGKGFPLSHDLESAEPVYTELPGWNDDIRGFTRYEELPVQAKDFISFIETFTGKRVSIISTGPDRQQLIDRFLMDSSDFQN